MPCVSGLKASRGGLYEAADGAPERGRVPQHPPGTSRLRRAGEVPGAHGRSGVGVGVRVRAAVPAGVWRRRRAVLQVRAAQPRCVTTRRPPRWCVTTARGWSRRALPETMPPGPFSRPSWAGPGTR